MGDGHGSWFDAVLKESMGGQKDGCLDIPTAPCPGIAMDEKALEKYPSRPAETPGGYVGRFTFASRRQSRWVCGGPEGTIVRTRYTFAK